MSSMQVGRDVEGELTWSPRRFGSERTSRMAVMVTYREFEPSIRFRQALAVSPDGAQVAYVDDASGQFNLAVRPLSGETPRHLTSYTDSSVRRAAWHPDGRS